VQLPALLPVDSVNFVPLAQVIVRFAFGTGVVFFFPPGATAGVLTPLSVAVVDEAARAAPSHIKSAETANTESFM
jgi:hypothetical protein